MNVAILGASNKPERYAHKALQSLLRHGHKPILVNPGLQVIDGLPVVPDLDRITDPVDTLTVYVGPEISAKLEEKIVRLKPSRVIFNPGAENPALGDVLTQNGIQVQEACTLVLLRTNQF